MLSSLFTYLSVFLVVQHFRALDYGIFVDAVIDFVQFFLAVILVKFLEIGIFLQLFPGFHCPKDIGVVQVIGCVDCHIVAEMAGGLISPTHTYFSVFPPLPSGINETWGWNYRSVSSQAAPGRIVSFPSTGICNSSFTYN